MRLLKAGARTFEVGQERCAACKQLNLGAKEPWVDPWVKDAEHRGGGEVFE
jgi:hypothetical protein